MDSVLDASVKKGMHIFFTLRSVISAATKIICDDSDGPGHAPPYLGVSPLIMTDKHMITVNVTRDSVCAGDDVDAPHEVSHLFDSATTKESILNDISRKTVDTHYPEQKWICVWNGIEVAEYRRSGCSIDLNKIVLSNTNDVHFKYVWIR